MKRRWGEGYDENVQTARRDAAVKWGMTGSSKTRLSNASKGLAAASA